MKVPFLDLKAQYLSIKEEIHVAINEVIENTAFALGPAVSNFEKNFADYIGVKHCVAVSSGTAALHLALLAAGVKEGDEVITTPHTFVSTCWAISYIKAVPVFVDIDPKTYTIDADLIKDKITEKTKVILPVHLYGRAANMDRINSIAKEFDLTVIEDAAQAHGAELNGKLCGQFGEMACFSFYPGKNLGAYGEGGAVVTNNEDLAEIIRLYRNHCQPEKYIHDDIGYNYRMDGIQGAVLNIKLNHLDNWNGRRREIAHKYSKSFIAVNGLTPPYESEDEKHIYHLYELKLESKEKRDGLLKFLAENDIFPGLHYPIPVHLQKAYAHLGHKQGDFHFTEEAADCLISLPIYAEMTDDMVDFVIDKVKEY